LPKRTLYVKIFLRLWSLATNGLHNSDREWGTGWGWKKNWWSKYKNEAWL